LKRFLATKGIGRTVAKLAIRLLHEPHNFMGQLVCPLCC
jgi:hypothetical protein